TSVYSCHVNQVRDPAAFETHQGGRGRSFDATIFNRNQYESRLQELHGLRNELNDFIGRELRRFAPPEPGNSSSQDEGLSDHRGSHAIDVVMNDTAHSHSAPHGIARPSLGSSFDLVMAGNGIQDFDDVDTEDGGDRQYQISCIQNMIPTNAGVLTICI